MCAFLLISGLIFAKHLFFNIIIPKAQSIAPEIKEKAEAASKDRALSKASKNLKNIKALRDAELLSEVEYQEKIQDIKRSI